MYAFDLGKQLNGFKEKAAILKEHAAKEAEEKEESAKAKDAHGAIYFFRDSSPYASGVSNCLPIRAFAVLTRLNTHTTCR